MDNHLRIKQFYDKIAMRAPRFCQVILLFLPHKLSPGIHLRPGSVSDAHFRNYTSAPPVEGPAPPR